MTAFFRSALGLASSFLVLATVLPISSASAGTSAKSAIAPANDAAIAEDDFFTAKSYPLQTIGFPGGVTMTEMVYSTLPGFRPLTLDLYEPSGQGLHPGLVFIHGGNWRGGDSRQNTPFGNFPGLLASIAARGYVVASVNYRLSDEARFPAALIDVKTAIRFLRSRAADFHLDGARIAAWGTSAGGNLAAMAAVTCGTPSLEPPGSGDTVPPSDCVQAAIDWCGLINLETAFSDFGKPMPADNIEAQYLGCQPSLCLSIARAASPLTYASAKSPPMLIQHGDMDVTVSPKQAQELYDALKSAGAHAELEIYPGVAHMFARPRQSGGGADTETDRTIVAKMEQFLDATFSRNGR